MAIILYLSSRQRDDLYFDSVGPALDIYNDKYVNILLAGDFNAEDNENILKDFLELYNLHNLVKEKHVLNHSFILHLFLTNCNMSFQHTKALSTGLSDCHKMIVTVLKTTFKKAKPKGIFYRSYKYFDKNKFRDDLR